MHNATDDKSRIVSILLVGEHCIQSQFIQRELNKAGYDCSCCLAPQSYDTQLDFSAFEVILTSHQTLQGSPLIDFLSSAKSAVALVIYDVPASTNNALFLSIQNLKGILYEHAPIEHLAACLRHVTEGDFWLPRKLMAELLSSYQLCTARPLDKNGALQNLTKREQQIIELVVQGKSNLVIAEELFVAESTVKTHIYRLYKKLNVRSRKEVISRFGHIAFTYRPKMINNIHHTFPRPQSNQKTYISASGVRLSLPDTER